MSEDLIIKYLIAFIIGWLASRMIGNGFSVGGGSPDTVRCNPTDWRQLCPGGLPCPDCGEDSCECPNPYLCRLNDRLERKLVEDGDDPNFTEWGNYDFSKNICDEITSKDICDLNNTNCVWDTPPPAPEPNPHLCRVNDRLERKKAEGGDGPNFTEWGNYDLTKNICDGITRKNVCDLNNTNCVWDTSSAGGRGSERV